MPTRVELFAYIKKQWDMEPDYPFARYPDAAIFRHPGNRKWFAVVIRVSRSKSGLRGKKECEVVDLEMRSGFCGLRSPAPRYFAGLSHEQEALDHGSAGR